MTERPFIIRDDARPELETFLSEQIYVFNCEVTGVVDGRLLNASLEDDAGNVVAAINGHTWGGSCEILNLWVREDYRGQGYGSGLLKAAEQEALHRACDQMVLITHSFQAPRFYEAQGYRRLCAVPDYPRGHEKITYGKSLSR